MLATKDFIEATRHRIRGLIAEDAKTVSKPLADALKIISTRIFEEDFRLRSLGGNTRVGVRSLRNCFRKELGCSAQTYVTNHRMIAARRLLENSRIPVWKVSASVGYKSPDAFIRAYTRWSGTCPSAERESLVAREIVGEPPVSSHDDTLRTFEHRLLKSLWPGIADWAQDSQRNLIRFGYRPNFRVTFDALIKKSSEGCRDDRTLGVEIAQLALDLLLLNQEGLAGEEHNPLHLEGLLNKANALRLASDLTGSHDALRAAENMVCSAGVSAELKAKVILQKALLYTFERLFEESEAAYSAAEEVLQNTQDSKLASQFYLDRGFNQELQGNMLAAAKNYESALGCLTPNLESDHYLLVCCYHRLASASFCSGDLAKARECLDAAGRFAETCNTGTTSAHLGWLNGMIRQADGDSECARQKLIAAQSALLEAGEIANAAILTLDLAAVCLSIGRESEGRELAEEAACALACVRLDRESLLSLELFKESMVKGRLTHQALALLRRSLESKFDIPRSSPWQKSPP